MSFTETSATTLPSQSLSPLGYLQINYKCWEDNGYSPVGTFDVRLYCTSDASTAFSATWANIKTQTISATQTKTITYLDINNERFAEVRSFAIHIATPTGYLVTASVTPISLEYSDTGVEVLDSASGVGGFYYLAMDGGAI